MANISHQASMIQALRFLRNADPAVYEVLTSSLQGYVNELVTATVTCDAAEVMEARGRAQAGLKLVDLFTTKLNQPTSP